MRLLMINVPFTLQNTHHHALDDDAPQRTSQRARRSGFLSVGAKNACKAQADCNMGYSSRSGDTKFMRCALWLVAWTATWDKHLRYTRVVGPAHCDGDTRWCT
jgi:hypothetical protein